MTTGQSSRSSRTKEPSATDHQEIEWQFDASELEPVEGWLDQHDSGSSALHIAPDSTIEITDTYYDTDDWRFYRAGYALRVRNTDGAVEATMKSLTPAEGSLRRRREISLDTSEIPLGEETARLTRVEVEAGIGMAPTPDLLGFMDEMQSALELTPASISKYETGLYASGLNPEGDTELGPTHVDPSMSLGEVAFAVLRAQFAEMQNHEPGTRLGEDPEELHDMRVPTRRMRAAMKVFEGALPGRASWLREELRWVAHALGEVRDLDVQLERFQAWKEEAGEEDSGFLDRILSITHKRREEARKNMLETLDSVRYERLRSSFSEMLRLGPAAELAQTNGKDEAVTATAPALVAGRYRKWRKAAKRLDENSSPEAFHDVRKKGKRLRYTLEFVSEIYGKPVQKLAKPLKALQDDLGDHQDTVVTAEYLRELGTTTGEARVPRGVAFTMGVYAERCAREAKYLRSVVPGSKPFRALTKGKKWKKFEKVLKSRNEANIPNKGPR